LGRRRANAGHEHRCNDGRTLGPRRRQPYAARMAFLGTWISVAVGIAALAFTVLSYLNRRGRARVEYIVTMSRPILPGRVADDFEVAHQGVMVADPAVSVLRIVNTGDRAIRPEDFETDLTVTFDAVDKIVSASWSATRPDDLRPGIEIEGDRVLVAPRSSTPAIYSNSRCYRPVRPTGYLSADGSLTSSPSIGRRCPTRPVAARRARCWASTGSCGSCSRPPS